MYELTSYIAYIGRISAIECERCGVRRPDEDGIPPVDGQHRESHRVAAARVVH